AERRGGGTDRTPTARPRVGAAGYLRGARTGPPTPDRQRGPRAALVLAHRAVRQLPAQVPVRLRRQAAGATRSTPVVRLVDPQRARGVLRPQATELPVGGGAARLPLRRLGALGVRRPAARRAGGLLPARPAGPAPLPP